MESGRTASMSRLGSLVPAISPMRPGSASTPNACSKTYEAGPPMPRPAGGRSETPAHSGAAGAVAMPMPVAIARDSPDPARTERALIACLPPRLRSSLREKLSDEYELVGFELLRPLVASEAETVVAWLDELDRPASHPELVQEITRCLLLTRAAKQDQQDQALRLAALAQELKAFPADVVIAAMRQWARREKWWPTLADLRDACQHAMRVRRSLRHCCERDAFGLPPLPVRGENR